ncbi:hypothetical protein F6X38_20600 [Aureimonas leprariae]|uniref:Uncharacterized protein n=1 Tax=Plantimonas leprariae TaxID=2615207 RepID=A0A7V7PL83_9HYPH|nr:hypothetical protein F6X38_20600 [Aureimonas leprariae]
MGRRRHPLPSDLAASWFASLPPRERPSPILPELCRRFGLTQAEARLVVLKVTLEHGRAE